MRMRSASSNAGDSARPAARRRPAISSESLRFIWQPSVQTWKRGSAWSSRRYSARRSSSGSAARRGPPEAADAGIGGARSSTGRARRGLGSASIMAGLRVRLASERGLQFEADFARHPQGGMRLGVRLAVAMVVRAPGGQQCQGPRGRLERRDRLDAEAAVVDLEAGQADRLEAAEQVVAAPVRRRSARAPGARPRRGSRAWLRAGPRLRAGRTPACRPTGCAGTRR